MPDIFASFFAASLRAFSPTAVLPTFFAEVFKASVFNKAFNPALERALPIGFLVATLAARPPNGTKLRGSDTT